MSTKKKADYWVKAGLVERGRNYGLKQGYSWVSGRGLSTQPWATYKEAQNESKQRGMRAVFVDLQSH